MTQAIIHNRLTTLFQKKNKNLLSIYFTAGFPALNDTVRILKTLQKEGVDIVEIGIPFSDPLADGPTIQASSLQALNNGMTLHTLISQLHNIRSEINIPILLMGYLNPVMQYGIEEFCQTISNIGIDGVIIPDLPLNEYHQQYKQLFEAHNLSNIFLVTPQTSPDRLAKIDNLTQGFIYVVSTDSTTGSDKNIKNTEAYLSRIKSARLKNPTMIGFNIRDRESFEYACNYANGAIIGTAFINAIKDSTYLENDICAFIKKIRG